MKPQPHRPIFAEVADLKTQQQKTGSIGPKTSGFLTKTSPFLADGRELCQPLTLTTADVIVTGAGPL
jgi:hypothetical protein